MCLMKTLQDRLHLTAIGLLQSPFEEEEEPGPA